jgi:hypothetical protein
VHVSIRSLVFVANATSGELDLIAADTSRSQLLLYTHAQGAAQVLWEPSKGVAHPSDGKGPVAPDGMSVDSAGNVFVASSASGNSTKSELWVLPRNGGSLPGGYGLPLLVDRNFGGLRPQFLEDSLIVRTATGVGAVGDLLLLTIEPASVLQYSRASVAQVLAGSGPIAPYSTLLGAGDFPKREAPGGFDVWPYDGSLLITTGKGRILRFAADGSHLPDFAAGLGNGKFKIRTGYEAGVALAVIADNNGGDILKFGPPPVSGANLPISTVTSGVQHPQGVVVSNVGVVAASKCAQSAGGCNALGNVLSHSIASATTPNGTLAEEPCILQVDPRITEFGTCRGHSLKLANICEGYEDIVIPDYLCGGSGASGKGFALINTTTTGSINFQNALVENKANPEALLGTSAIPCPANVLGWAPKANEGVVVEGNVMLELTGACGSSRAFSRELSIWGVGLVLDVDALPGATTEAKLYDFSLTKYAAMTATIVAASASIADVTEGGLSSCLATSLSYFERLKYLNAAAQLLACDGFIEQNLNSFAGSTANPNPAGELRGRLANLYLTINTRILGNPANANWPPSY